MHYLGACSTADRITEQLARAVERYGMPTPAERTRAQGVYQWLLADRARRRSRESRERARAGLLAAMRTRACAGAPQRLQRTRHTRSRSGARPVRTSARRRSSESAKSDPGPGEPPAHHHHRRRPRRERSRR